MKPIPMRRTLNRLVHLSGQIAANHGTLASLVPSDVRRCDSADELGTPTDRAWREALDAGEALQEALRGLADRLTSDDDEPAEA